MADLVRAIPMSDIAHPLVDQVGESAGRRWSLTESRAPVVIADSWRLDLLRRCTERDRELVLATDETSTLTPALVHVWRTAGAHWLVRDPAGGLREGFSGRSLRDLGDLWSTRMVRSPTDTPDTADVAVRHLRPQTSNAWELTAVVSTRLPARGSSVLGGGVVELSEAVGDAPEAWGPAEPVARPWDVDALTAAVRERMPRPVRALARGERTAAVLQVRRTIKGVEETTYATVATVGDDTDLGAQAAARVTEALVRVAGTTMPLVGVVVAQRGRRDLLRAPFLRELATPVALLIGPPVWHDLGMTPDSERRRVGAEPVGRAKIPALLYRLSTDPSDPVSAWRALERVCVGIDTRAWGSVLGDAGVALRSARPSEQPPGS